MCVGCSALNSKDSICFDCRLRSLQEPDGQPSQFVLLLLEQSRHECKEFVAELVQELGNRRYLIGVYSHYSLCTFLQHQTIQTHTHAVRSL